ncbi:SDR family oxidoreductase [Croceicoccus sp. BE223]|uniref:SDR family NAD(P)-dependent oxidoreductase n=1 Tax=Croceicoccus sp. BE223 TaxID=2817716 RepID=UPI00286D60CB|nr:SDR family oxidoreductase [Croceicoccus sp. BE223]
MRYSGKVAIVTGGGRGIGFAVARRLGVEGASIAIADLDMGHAENAVARLRADGIEAEAFCCDVADEPSIVATVRDVVARLGRLDVLVANAGLHLTGYTKTPCELSGDDWRRLMDVNVIGIVNGARASRAAMRERGGGVIVTISSMAGYKGENAYGISKLAVNGLTVALAKELAADCIRVCGVAPGLVDSEEAMARFPQERREKYVNELQLVKRLGRTDDIAAAVAFLASEEASFVTGETMIVSGGAFCRI